jgi:hypothetical protein
MFHWICQLTKLSYCPSPIPDEFIRWDFADENPTHRIPMDGKIKFRCIKIAD